VPPPHHFYFRNKEKRGSEATGSVWGQHGNKEIIYLDPQMFSTIQEAIQVALDLGTQATPSALNLQEGPDPRRGQPKIAGIGSVRAARAA
jgi:hypothetical protein